jgi:ribonucleotide reductase beta subunit family protein with ferritin-like domain
MQQARFLFLRKLYEKRDPTILGLDVFEVGKEIGLEKDSIISIVTYLENKGLITMMALGGTYRISQSGIEHVEQILESDSGVQDTHSKRKQFLLNLYREKGWASNMYSIGNKLGLNEKTVDDIVFYWANKGIVEFPMLGPFVRLTTAGIDFVESESDS